MRGVDSLPGTLCDLLASRADTPDEQIAFTFLDNGEHDGAQLSWGALVRRSHAVAAAIRQRTGPGSRVLLLFPPGLGVVPALLGTFQAGAIAIPAYPPSAARHDRTLLRLRGIVGDAGVELIVSCASVASRQDWLATAIPELRGLEWIVLEETPDVPAPRIEAPSPDAVALLQYTSGSTAVPRGVMVTHRNLMSNLAASAHLGQHDAASVSVSWLPVNHDMGLIQGILQPIFSGFSAWLMAPVAFLQRPARWLEAMSRLGATHSGGPNFAFDLCVRRVATDAALDLRRWRVAFCGAEPIRPATVEAFTHAFAGCGFRPEALRPSYGLAEATLLVTTTRAGEAPRTLTVDGRALSDGQVRLAETHAPPATPRTIAGCGRPIDGARLAVVDPLSRHRLEDGRVGEIWIAGDSVAAGYWRQPAATAATFHARLESDRHTAWLRTGDLGFIHDGEIFVTGRCKDTLIVRGLKHDPHDIELTVEALGALRPGGVAVFALDTPPDRIVLIGEVDRGHPAPEASVIDGIRAAVAARHGIQLDAVLILAAGALPKTTSGKVQRYACRDALRAGLFEPLARWDGAVTPWPLEHSA